MANRKFILTFILLLLFIIAIFFSVMSEKNSASKVWEQGDLDNDGIIEEYSLANKVLTIKENSLEIWSSPKEYAIDSFSLGDVNNDGHINLVISLWKEGSFDRLQPFWHTEKNKDYKNHLFVYRLEDNKFKQVWCSSNLAHPIVAFKIQDIDGDTLNELVVEEGQYKQKLGGKYTIDPNGLIQNTVWEWDEWGFSLQENSKY